MAIQIELIILLAMISVISGIDTNGFDNVIANCNFVNTTTTGKQRYLPTGACIKVSSYQWLSDFTSGNFFKFQCRNNLLYFEEYDNMNCIGQCVNTTLAADHFYFSDLAANWDLGYECQKTDCQYISTIFWNQLVSTDPCQGTNCESAPVTMDVVFDNICLFDQSSHTGEIHRLQWCTNGVVSYQSYVDHCISNLYVNPKVYNDVCPGSSDTSANGKLRGRTGACFLSNDFERRACKTFSSATDTSICVPPTASPTEAPTTQMPTAITSSPSTTPSKQPTDTPTTHYPTTNNPTTDPTTEPTTEPITTRPTRAPITRRPTEMTHSPTGMTNPPTGELNLEGNGAYQYSLMFCTLFWLFIFCVY